MKLSTMRWANLVLALPVLLLVHSTSRGQSPSPAPSLNRFVGTWKLNVEKSSPGLVSKLVIVVNQGNDFKLALDTVRENGYKAHSWAITSINGEVVKTFGKDGKPRIDENNGQSTAWEWRVTLDGADAFLLDWLGPNPLQQNTRSALATRV